MSDILVSLDEALTERYGDPNHVVLNSFLTKRGKDYSSAIIDVLVNSRGYVYVFESSFDGKLYDCVVKDINTNKRLEHLCVKTANPVKAFERAIVEAVNVSNKMREHYNIVEDMELLANKSHAENNNGVTYTDDTRVEDHDKHVEDNLKNKKKKLKKSDKFKVEDEPNQKNTQGEEIAKINLKETEENTITKLNELKNKLKTGEEDLDSIASQLDLICNEAGYEGLWKDGLTFMEYAKEAIQKAMAEDFERGKAMLKNLDDTDATYAYLDGYGNYRNLTADILDNMIYDAIAELSVNEAEDLEAEEETPLEEDTMPKAIFHRKPSSVDSMRTEEENGLVTNKSSYVVNNEKELNKQEFLEFSNNLLKDYEWLKELYNEDNLGVFNCIRVYCTEVPEYEILVDPNGYSYSRYAALVDKLEGTKSEESLEEPIE